MQSSYAKNYRRLWEGHWWWQSRRRFVLARIAELAARRPLARILDVGCGDGLFFDDLSRFGEPWGVEPDPALVDPSGRWAARVAVAPFGSEDHDGRRYDLILMLDSLEHMADDVSATARAASLLLPGGALLVTAPAMPSLWSVHDEANHHHRRYTSRSLRTVLEGAGLRVESLGYCFAWTVLPMYARKLLGGGRRGGADYEVLPPPAPVNAALRWATLLEQELAGRRGTPIGSSLFAVARRPEAR